VSRRTDSGCAPFERQPPIAVSVIVPVYNSRDYLARCLDSLTGQTLEDIEIVAVDDGSTDDSLEILQRYADEDRRVKIVRHARNEGLHVARISGVLASSGGYIGYVDSDDYASSDMFECMYRQAVGGPADVVRTGAWLLREGDPQPLPPGGSAASLSFSKHTYSTGIDYLDVDFYPAMWLHLHHRRLWDMALPHFPRVRLIGEDNLTSFVLAFFANQVVSLSTVGYFYVERDNSLTGDQSFPNVVRHIEDRATIVRLLRQFIDTRGGRAERCWNTLRANNRGLLFSYIASLESHAERLAAAGLFEERWGESVPADVKSASCLP
jgi:glycosyltransferase involved in cell wall biosynthesis